MHITNGKEILENLNRANLPNSYQPISVLECSNPYVLESYNNCHGYDVLKAKNFNTEVYAAFDASLKEFKAEFIEKFELTDTTVEDVTIKMIANYWDSVICDIYE